MSTEYKFWPIQSAITSKSIAIGYSFTGINVLNDFKYNNNYSNFAILAVKQQLRN